MNDDRADRPADTAGAATARRPAVEVERDAVSGGVTVITLNRPERRNALTLELKEALLAAVSGVAADPSVRAVVLTGSGPAFCVGQDLREHAETLAAAGSVREGSVPEGSVPEGSVFSTVEQHYNPIVSALAGMPKPVVAAINGSCVGAGLGFALACDLRVAAEGATFATAFAAIGLTADSGLSASLVHSLGAARAAELLLLGESFTAEQAASWGLVRAVVPNEQLLDAALELARTLAAGPTLAYAEIKKALALGAVSPLEEVLAAEGAAQSRLGRTKDHSGAVEAFLAKRRPTFEGA